MYTAFLKKYSSTPCHQANGDVQDCQTETRGLLLAIFVIRMAMNLVVRGSAFPAPPSRPVPSDSRVCLLQPATVALSRQFSAHPFIA